MRRIFFLILVVLVFLGFLGFFRLIAQTPEEVKAVLSAQIAAEQAAKAAQLEAAKVSLREQQELDMIINCWQSWVPIGTATLIVWCETADPGVWIIVATSTRNVMPSYIGTRLNGFSFTLPDNLPSRNIYLEWTDVTLTPVNLGFYSGWVRECQER